MSAERGGDPGKTIETVGRSDEQRQRRNKIFLSHLVGPAVTFWRPNSQANDPPLSNIHGSRKDVPDHQLLWIAFAFAAGIALYMMLPDEPQPWAVGVLMAVSGGFAFRFRQVVVRNLWLALGLAVLSGFSIALLQTHLASAPRLSKETTRTVSGIVSDRQESTHGVRLVLEVRDVALSGNTGPPDGFPEKIRVSVPDTSYGRIGDGVEVRARLFPPAGPVRPGGYDFAFRAYFDQIGATGFAYGAARPVDLGSASLLQKVRRWLDDLRQGISGRIRMALGPGDPSALAVALLVGDRSHLSEGGEEALRQAGLAHILAISGLHMALFAGGAYSVFLLLLSFSESVSLRFATHRIAALAALGAAAAYLALSGASVATQRSFIMVFLVFLGILCGRRGLTLRSVALAALVLLIIAPERLFYPGFQMSFSAVLCLVAVYETWRARQSENLGVSGSLSGTYRIARKGAGWIAGLVVTALVAGAATGIIGAYHFGRVAPYGLIGNVLGMPVFSLVIMPMGVLALVLLPFGLAIYPLKVMAFGLDLLLDMARWTASLPDGGGVIAAPSASVTLLGLSSLFAGVLLTGRRRLAAIAPLALAVGIAAGARPPDVQIAERGKLVAARDKSGNLRISGTRTGFAAEIWLQAEGAPSNDFQNHRMTAPQRACDKGGCIVAAYPLLDGSLFGDRYNGEGAAKMQPAVIAFPETQRALLEDCRWATVIVTSLGAPEECRADLVIDGSDRKALGALSLWLTVKKTKDGVAQAGIPQVFRSGNAFSETTNPPQSAAEPVWVTVVSKWQAARTVPARPWHR